MDDAERDERGEHRHAALGVVQDPGGAPDQHERQADGGVDHAEADPPEREGDELAHVAHLFQQLGPSKTQVVVAQAGVGGKRRRVGDGDDPAEVEHNALVGDGEGAARVLLDEQDRDPPLVA